MYVNSYPYREILQYLINSLLYKFVELINIIYFKCENFKYYLSHRGTNKLNGISFIYLHNHSKYQVRLSQKIIHIKNLYYKYSK